MITSFIIDENFQVFLEKEKHVIDQWTNQQTNPQTNPQTDPLIEMQKLFFYVPDDTHEEKPSILEFKKMHNGPTDEPTNRWTDRPSYGDARRI